MRVFFIQGVEKEDIADMAEGLNRLLQVDDKSLRNLQGMFNEIKKALAGKPGADQIAYRQGDPGETTSCSCWRSWRCWTSTSIRIASVTRIVLFGQPKLLLEKFVAAADDPNASYKRMLPRLHEILRLTDEVQRLMAEELGRFKISGKKKDNRVASAKNKGEPAYFAGGKIGGHIPMGWLYPPLPPSGPTSTPTSGRREAGLAG